MDTQLEHRSDHVQISVEDVTLQGSLTVPEEACGIVLFAHGGEPDRRSPRVRAVAESFHEAGLGTLLFDLLTEDEEREDRVTAHLRFDVPLLAQRVAGAAEWLEAHDATRDLSVGAFGAGTGSGAALLAAALHPQTIRAVVSQGGRPDLAGEALARVEAPTLLLAGARDEPTLAMNRKAARQLKRAEVELELIEGAIHFFEEDGAMDEAVGLAAEWFRRHLDPGEGAGAESPGEGGTPRRERAAAVYRGPAEIAALVAEAAEPFDAIEDAGLDALLDRIGEAEVVLFGEASHGTSEFYRMRQRITQRLIEEKGFTIVAAEADWPDAERVDEYVRGRTGRDERPWEAFARFPTWMWRNRDVLGFVEWLRDRNDGRPKGEQVGFFGLDLYSLYTSMHEVLAYLEDRDPDLADTARERYSCLAPFEADPALYGRAVVTEQYRGCEDEAVAMLRDLLTQRLDRVAAPDGRRLFDATQNAAVVRDAERYYRSMFYGSPSSWNLRDTHMFETLRAVRAFHDGAKAVVWAHNSHVGDAAATQMGARGEINIGHLCREEYGPSAYLVGFGTHTGTVAAASNWGEPVEVKRVRPSHAESYERVCHDTDLARFLLPLRAGGETLRYELGHPRLERAIGVIYRPETELQSHYFHAALPSQFDEFVWFDESTAVEPLEQAQAPALPQRHPFRLLAD
jgi:erythromycin esterase-like protein/dienelactone hydrolase